VLCEQQLFLPLLRAFEMFLPSCSLLSFIRSLQVSSNSLFSLWFFFSRTCRRIECQCIMI
jgi:hypothetical protein